MQPPPGASGVPIDASDAFDIPVIVRWSDPLAARIRPRPERLAQAYQPWPAFGPPVPPEGDYLVSTTWRDVIDAAVSVGRDPTAWLTAMPALAWSEIVARRSPLSAYLSRADSWNPWSATGYLVEPNMVYTRATEKTAQAAFGYRIGMTMAEWACRGLMGLGPTLHAEALVPGWAGPAWAPQHGLPDLVGDHPVSGLPWLVEAKGGVRPGLPTLRQGAEQLTKPGLAIGPHVKMLCGASLTDCLFVTLDVEHHQQEPVGPEPGPDVDPLVALARSRMLHYLTLRALPSADLRVLPVGPGVGEGRRRGRGGTVTLLEDDPSTQEERAAARQNSAQYRQRPGLSRRDMLIGAVPGTDLVVGMSRRLYSACEALADVQAEVVDEVAATEQPIDLPLEDADTADFAAFRQARRRQYWRFEREREAETAERTRAGYARGEERSWDQLVENVPFTADPAPGYLEAATPDTYLAVQARTVTVVEPR